MAEYRVVIVDDEKPIAEGLKAFINWEEEGFTVVGTAYNGEAGVEAAVCLEADVVMTDIRMPLLSGHGLINRVREIKPECIFLVLSGYNNFEYAQEAINSGAVCYLLKPIQEDELRNTLRRIRKQLDARQASAREISLLRERLEQLKPVLLEKGLYETVSDKRSGREQILERWNRLNTGYALERFAVMVAEPDDLEKIYHDDTENIVYVDYQITQLIEKYIEENRIGVSFRNSRGQTVFICCVPERVMQGELRRIAGEMQEKVFSNTNATISIGISAISDDPGTIHMIYKQAQKALEYRLLRQDGCVILADELAPETDMSLYPISLEKEMLDCIEMGDLETSVSRLNEIFAYMTDHRGSSPNFVYTICTGIVVSVLHKAVTCGISTEDIRRNISFGTDRLSEMRSVPELRQKVTELVEYVVCQIHLMRDQQQNGVIGDICRYVEEHYQDNISLDFIEEKFFINASYLSYLFKKKTGQNFIGYLTEVRIENAKKLLRQPELKVYEVGTLVGYGSSRYFSQIFEKKVGMTPTEYRKVMVR